MKDWNKRLEALSYYVYGEVLSAEEFDRRINQKQENDLYIMEGAQVAFPSILIMMGA